MAITPQQVHCDICGRLKQDVNHWWLFSVDGGIHLDAWGEGWEAADKHLCGHECVIKAVSEWMQGQKKAATA